MRAGVAVSVLAHAGVLAWSYFGVLASVPDKLPDIEALPIELVTVAEFTDLKKGKESAEKKETAAISEPAPVVKPDPTPTPAPEPVVEKTPPPPPVVAEKPPEPAPTPKPDPVPAPEKTKAEPPPEKVAKVDAAPVPKPRPKPKAPPIAADKKKEFDVDRIAALVNRNDKSAAASDQKASLGTSTGKVEAKMTESELDGLRRKIYECLSSWNYPQGALEDSEVRTVIKFNLKEDGTIAGAPEVVTRPLGQYAQVSPDAAIRQIYSCAPFKLPREHYAVWRELTVDFNTKAMR